MPVSMCPLAQMKMEKKLRKGRKDGDFYAHGFGSFSGMNLGTVRGNCTITAPQAMPYHRSTPSPGNRALACGINEVSAQSPVASMQSLAQWVRAVKNASGSQIHQQQAGLPPKKNHPDGDRRLNSLGSVGMISEAGSRWENHGRLDSCAASAWDGVVHISDVESSTQCDDEVDSIGSCVGTDRKLCGRGRSRSSGTLSRNEWDGLERTSDLGRSYALDTTPSTTFFYHLEAPQWENEEDDNERSPGAMTAAMSSGLPTFDSRRCRPRQVSEVRAADEHGEAMSRWRGSPGQSPAGITISETFCACPVSLSKSKPC